MMKKIMVAGIFVFAAALFVQVGLCGAVTIADYPAGRVASGIGSSRHNLGAFGRVITTSATSEICVFCHTPHHSDVSNNKNPLWNKGNATTYSAYGTTVSGTVIANSAIGSTTLMCLSCHDGITTFDNIVNTPGKGGVVVGGADRGWAFKMPKAGFTPTTAYDHFDDTIDGGGDGGGMGGGGMGGGSICDNMMCHLNPAIRLSVGTDLSNDHPVSVPYNPMVLTTLRPTSTVISSIDLTAGLNQTTAPTVYGGNLAQNRWAVNGFISDTATIADLLRDGKVECSSCHDPHFRNLSWDEVEDSWANWDWCDPGGDGGMMGGMGGGGGGGENCTDGNFLRRVGGNTGSALCRTCHDK